MGGCSPTALTGVAAMSSGVVEQSWAGCYDLQPHVTGHSLATVCEQEIVLSQNVAVCGGLRRWGSSVPCCLPLVKTSKSKGLPK